MGRRLNGNTLAADNGHQQSVEGVSRVREKYECGSVSNGDKLIKYDLVCLT